MAKETPKERILINAGIKSKSFILQKQVNVEHYDFRKYISKSRWNSFYHQIDEIIRINPSSILEIGLGSSVLRIVMKYLLNYYYESMDIDEELKPDFIGSVLEIPFLNNKYDVIVCFQVLEHLPYENFEKALSELFRVAKKAVIISLPNAGKVLKLHISKICEKKFFKWLFTKIKKHNFDGEHYWEINKKGYEIKKVLKNMIEIAEKNNYILEKEYRIWENPYHHFFIFRKKIDVKYAGTV